MSTVNTHACCFQARYGNHVFENSGWGDYESDEPLEDADCIFVLSLGRYGEAAAPLGGIAQENMRRGLVFESFEAASDYLLRLIRSATIDDFRLKSLVLTEDFFKVRVLKWNMHKFGASDVYS